MLYPLVEPPAALTDLHEQLPPLYVCMMCSRSSFRWTRAGAPKLRAVEFIDELEPVKRGACGYLSFGGDMGVAIAMRAGIVKDHTLYVQAAA